jgi:3-oxoacyl-[acyl-carrier protein] reductase
MTEPLLRGKTTGVRGAAQRSGYAIAGRSNVEGAHIVVGDACGEAAAETSRRLGDEAAATGLRCSFPSAEEAQAILDAAPGLSPVGAVANNAGMTQDAAKRKATDEQFDQITDIHFKGARNGTRLASAAIYENGGGTIANTSSLSGKIGLEGQTNLAPKAGTVALTKTAAMGFGHLNVRVSGAIQPRLFLPAVTEVMPQKLLPSGFSSYTTGPLLEVTDGRYM